MMMKRVTMIVMKMLPAVMKSDLLVYLGDVWVI
jgi:hypothetical protein